MQALAALCALVLLARSAGFVVQWLLLRVLPRMRSTLVEMEWAQVLLHDSVLQRLAKAVPSLVMQSGVQAIPQLQPQWATLILNLAIACTIYHVARVISALLNAMNEAHELKEERKATQAHSIKSYVQLGKLLVFLIAIVLIVATLVDRSPLLLLSGLGAASAVLMLIFKDTIMSFVAGVQLGSNDMLRVGDWIEMPQVGADGFVIDIALHTVKVQNWDKTITTLPTRKLISEPFKNWRGMQESGGRRIKRSLFLDQTSVRFLTAQEVVTLRRFRVLTDYLGNKEKELAQWNGKLDEGDQYNARRLTNLGTFRAYLQNYLCHHAGINQNMTLLVRQMAPTSEGLPMEIYCFTNTVAWANYEAIQADIFDHLLAILPEFGLRVFQSPSGSDLQQVSTSFALPPLRAANEGS